MVRPNHSWACPRHSTARAYHPWAHHSAVTPHRDRQDLDLVLLTCLDLWVHRQCRARGAVHSPAPCPRWTPLSTCSNKVKSSCSPHPGPTRRPNAYSKGSTRPLWISTLTSQERNNSFRYVMLLLIKTNKSIVFLSMSLVLLDCSFLFFVI